jgi:hypothetical protein
VQTHCIASAGDWAVRSHAPTLVVQYRSGALPAPREDTPLRVLTNRDRATLWVVHEQVHMVGVAVELAQVRAETLAHLSHDLLAAGQYLVGERATPILRDKDQMGMEVAYDATSPAYIGSGSHRGDIDQC